MDTRLTPTGKDPTDNPGFCLACGADAEGVEPDASRYTCEACETPAVYGASELLIYMAD